MLSLIQHEVVVNHHWMTSAEFTNVVAISQMTPGPIGINSATYCGYTALHKATDSMLMGMLGSVSATLSLILPSFILMLDKQDVPQAHEESSGAERLRRSASRRRGTARRCHASAVQCGELQQSVRLAVAILYFHLPLRMDLHRRDVYKDKPHQDDRLRCLRWPATVVLGSVFYANISSRVIWFWTILLFAFFCIPWQVINVTRMELLVPV